MADEPMPLFDGAPGRPAVRRALAGRGRPPGMKNRNSTVKRRLAELETPAIIVRVCQAAKGGGMKAAEIILKRTWPEPRSAPVRVDIASSALGRCWRQFGPAS
jgi:hypothetical protein